MPKTRKQWVSLALYLSALALVIIWGNVADMRGDDLQLGYASIAILVVVFLPWASPKRFKRWVGM
jgi:hypothetical protein